MNDNKNKVQNLISQGKEIVGKCKESVVKLFKKKSSEEETKVMMMIVSEHPVDGVKHKMISGDKLKNFRIVGITIAVVLIGYLSYNTFQYAKSKDVVALLTQNVKDLQDENAQLILENEKLIDEIAILSDTLNQKVEVETEKRIPAGFPMAGPTTMEEEIQEDGSKAIIFQTAIGNNVVSSGDGLIKSVEVDETYGNKIVIDHENGYQSVYRAPGQVLVIEGDPISRGAELIEVIENKKTLLYQILEQDSPINPLNIMEING